jgi:DNA-directed RNA polymerase specialized sigma24 family protein
MHRGDLQRPFVIQPGYLRASSLRAGVDTVDNIVGGPSEGGSGPKGPNELDGLLARLDPDRDRAGEKYEDLRGKLIGFFERHECHPAQYWADQTLAILAKKNQRGGLADVIAFAFGIARKVRFTAQHNMRRETPLDDAATGPIVAGNEENRLIEQIDRETRLRWLERCMRRLATEDSSLVLDYYAAEAISNKEHRQKIAQRFGLTAQALRTRASRLRDKLEECVKALRRAGAPI